MRKATAFAWRRRAASESSRLSEGRCCIYVYILTSVLLIGICCRWYFRRGVVDV
jgi:hypothetical protein